MLQSESLDNWKTYLAFWVIDRNSPYMAQAFQDANLEFWNKTMLGHKEPLSRWRRCLQWADRDLGEAPGQAYVAKVFPPMAKRASKR